MRKSLRSKRSRRKSTGVAARKAKSKAAPQPPADSPGIGRRLVAAVRHSLPGEDRKRRAWFLVILLFGVLVLGIGRTLGQQVLLLVEALTGETWAGLQSKVHPPRAKVVRPEAPWPISPMVIDLQNAESLSDDVIEIEIDGVEKMAPQWHATPSSVEGESKRLSVELLGVFWASREDREIEVVVSSPAGVLGEGTGPLAMRPTLSVEGATAIEGSMYAGVAHATYRIGPDPIRIPMPPLVLAFPARFCLNVNGAITPVPSAGFLEVDPRHDAGWQLPGVYRIELCANGIVLDRIALIRDARPFLELDPSGLPWIVERLPAPKPDFWAQPDPDDGNWIRALAGDTGSLEHYILEFCNLAVDCGPGIYEASIQVSNIGSGSVSLRFPGIETPTPSGTGQAAMSLKVSQWFNLTDWTGVAIEPFVSVVPRSTLKDADRAASTEIKWPVQGLDLNDGVSHLLTLRLKIAKLGMRYRAAIELAVDEVHRGTASMTVEDLPPPVFPGLLQRGGRGGDFKDLRFSRYTYPEDLGWPELGPEGTPR